MLLIKTVPNEMVFFQHIQFIFQASFQSHTHTHKDEYEKKIRPQMFDVSLLIIYKANSKNFELFE